MILAIAKSMPRCPRSLTLGEVRLRLQLSQDERDSTQPDTFYVSRGTLALDLQRPKDKGFAISMPNIRIFRTWHENCYSQESPHS